MRLNHPLLLEDLQPERFLEAMRPHLKPGSVVVDIGAGTGNFAFLFAETVGETGKVYATDVDPDMIKHLAERLEKSLRKNISVVSVQAHGLDPFYKMHTFDVIFMAKVYQFLFDAQTYLRELRPSLKKDGRLYILQQTNEWEITRSRLDDFKDIIRLLSSSGENYPFFLRLDEGAKRFIRAWDGKEVPAQVEESILASFNEAVKDPFLYRDLAAYHYDKWQPQKLWEENLEPKNLSLARWLILHLEENQAFDKGKALSATDSEQIRMLNKLLILGTFSHEPVVPKFREETTIFLFEKGTIIKTAQRAGFRFVREYEDFPKHYLLEFESVPQEAEAAL